MINYNGDGACVRKYWNMNAYFEQFFVMSAGVNIVHVHSKI